ncbi:hypothetical protein H6503_06660 [Candidatus Woesearchaeota archaeon]|nr:hypothetical protein [Candidatus Woesearchaeota archaeon]
MRWMHGLLILLIVLLSLSIVFGGIGGFAGSSFNFIQTLSANTPTAGTGTGSSLIYDDEEITQMKQDAEEYYREIYYGSTDWWLDQICRSKIPSQGNSYAFIEYNEGIYITAHVEGEKRALTMFNESNTSTGEVNQSNGWQYKLSILIDNKQGSNSTMKFNVYVDATPLFNDTQKLEQGEKFAKIGSSMIIQDSVNDYDTICIKFSPPYPKSGPLGDLEDLKQVCNIITEVDPTGEVYNAPTYLETQIKNKLDGSSGSSGSSTSSTVNQI